MSCTIKSLITRLKENWNLFNLCLALTGAISGTSKEKIYRELGLESLEIDAGVEHFAFFIRSWKMKILNTSSA